MAQAPPPDPAITGWLTTLGVTSCCQWDVLLFLSHHHTTLLGAADLARLLGYASHTILVALDVLEAQALVARSRVSQGARLYQVRVPLDAARGAAFARLQTLATDRAGRVRVAQQLRRDHTPVERLDAAKHFLADAQQRLQVLRRQADIRAERRPRWRKAI
jgi:DNA-binding MarR family transcriptional regulator